MTARLCSRQINLHEVNKAPMFQLYGQGATGLRSVLWNATNHVALWRNGQRIGLLGERRRRDSKLVGSSPTRVGLYEL